MALPGLLEQGAGWIVTFGSTAAVVGAPRLAAYSAAKGAVLNFTKSIGAEYARQGLHVNCLCPGATEMPLLKRLMADRPDAAQFRDAQPIGRFGTPEEIAGVAAYLVSDEASFFVGSAVVCDGGFTLYGNDVQRTDRSDGARMTETTTPELSPEDLLGLYRRMLLIRRFEERAAELRMAGFIPGFLHPYIGQEAVAVGVCTASSRRRDHDTHRGHGHMLARGASPARMYAGALSAHGRLQPCEGRFAAHDRHRAQLPWRERHRRRWYPARGRRRAAAPARWRGGVAVSFFGDGATNEGPSTSRSTSRALEAALRLLCENNLYGEFTRQDRHQPIADVAQRADSYAMPGVIADGNDVLDVSGVAAEAVERAAPATARR